MQSKDKPRKRRIATMGAYLAVCAALVVGINGPLTSGAQGPTGPTGPPGQLKPKKCFHKHPHKHGKGKGQVKHNHKHKCVGHHKKKHFLP